MSESSAWREAVGFAYKPEWNITIALETTGNIPRSQASGASTRFELVVFHDIWWVDVWYRQKHFNHHKLASRSRGVITADTLALRPPKNLQSIGKWLRAVEKKLAIEMRRDRPYIRSNVKGAAKLVFAWIGETL